MTDPSPSPRTAFWETRSFALAMIALAAIPLLLPAIPPLTDLMGHMGRYRVQLDIGHSPYLPHYYRFDWGLIGNLGCDLLVELLGPILGLELAVKLIVLSIPCIMVAGLLLVAREIHGRVPATALFALPLAFGYPFQFGFVNFAFAMGLMLIAFAFWLRMARTGKLKARPYVFFVVSFLLWVAHSFAWGTLGILCFIAEVVRRRKEGKSWFETGWRAVVACLPLAPPALLLMPWRGGDSPKGTFDWFNWYFKWIWLRSVLRERVQIWDMASAALLYAVALSGLVWKPWRRYEPILGISAAVLIAIFVCLPRVLLSSAYADMRLVPYMLAILILALRPIADRRIAIGIAVAATLFFVGRISITTLAFLKFERNYTTQLKALDHVPMGSRVMALINTPCRSAWYSSRMEHLSSMATVRRQAFVNDQWVAPGAQLLRIDYRPAGRYYSHDPSQIVRRPDCRARNEPILEIALEYFPRDAYDYVWMIDMPSNRWPIDPDLVPIWEGNRFGVLYRIIHHPAPKAMGPNPAR
ncbi:hypothetical protein [Sphingomonas abietis]|uniref:Glycosyltransferase RgtA/B/C/D-like domain-containing protein n=1 Tax=Sphingomonas abietis TaxID=3012344 RepID=A0ABY7NQG7_9SPHN|nr:hypothetical protein [Sphingomonas abietis]WBO22696.1 hypothetical protein PBT88_00640 [Sphingomonas abietis]